MLFTIKGNYVDIRAEKIFPAELCIRDGKIDSINSVKHPGEDMPFIIPGFVDSHVHIESSLLTPVQFGRLAVCHGTVGTVSDPHEIANVCGIAGINFMVENGRQSPLKFHFGVPSCVPATSFETAGASLDADMVEELLGREDMFFLSEMMNFPGVLSKDDQVMRKLAAAKKSGKPIDGHAPGLRGQRLAEYIHAGILTDHEAVTEEEAREKLKLGMKILIREGTAAKNFDALNPLLHEFPDHIMFCSDDKHPDSLVEGHINQLCQRAVAAGIDVFKVLKAACINPVEHYTLQIGQLRVGDYADFLFVEDLVEFKVLQTYIDGKLVAENGESLVDCTENIPIVNNFNCSPVAIGQLDFSQKDLAFNDSGEALVIEAIDSQLITNKASLKITVTNNRIDAGIENDLLYMVVVNRYRPAAIAKALVKNFGLRQGAIASSVAHDSHNIIAVGSDIESILKAVNAIINVQGGLSCVKNEEVHLLELPVAGLMSDLDGYAVANTYSSLDQLAKSLGSQLSSPFMTLSFMGLLVIPHIKLSDKGLFDADAFRFLTNT